MFGFMVFIGCASSRPPLKESALAQRYAVLRQKVLLRQDSTKTASFRLRWRVREVDPHSDLILRIDYRRPASYHVVGKGPMDVPVFTGWVIDSNYVLVLHRERETLRGHLRDLEPEDFTLDIRPFGGFLRLFAGGVSALLPERLSANDLARAKHDPEHFTISDEQGRVMELDLWRSRLKSVTWRDETPGNRWVFRVDYDDFSQAYPFWRLESADWENLSGPGIYEWEVLAEKYNPTVPERLFIPPDAR